MGLFAYGTLRAPEVQRALFGREIPRAEAVLPDHRLLVDGDYYFVAPAEGATVRGELLALDGAELARADAWEDVPSFYVRLAVTVLEAGARREAWVYTRVGAEGVPAPGEGYAARPLGEVVAAVEQLARALDARSRSRR
jgi:gamma-glutamylcyclotransferase (GGCT)/AIG2-like uncharacterized protein YtfP